MEKLKARLEEQMEAVKKLWKLRHTFAAHVDMNARPVTLTNQEAIDILDALQSVFNEIHIALDDSTWAFDYVELRDTEHLVRALWQHSELMEPLDQFYWNTDFHRRENGDYVIPEKHVSNLTGAYKKTIE